MPPWAWPIVIALAFSLWWCFLMWGIGQIFGWAALARHYRATDQFQGKLRHFRTGKLGMANYGGSLIIGTNSHGLHLAMFFLFRVGHPPLFIPWEDVSVTFARRWLLSYCDFRFAKAPHVCLSFREPLAREIAADANQSWAAESASVE